MSNIVFDRFKRQERKKDTPKKFSFTPVQTPEPSPPVPLDELKKIFMNEDKPIEPSSPPVVPTERLFSGIEDFGGWYYEERDKNVFNDQQKAALNTLLDARTMIDNGCKCKRTERKSQAEEYFRIFWTQNQHTDLPKKIIERLGMPFKLAINGEIFLEFSS